MENLKQDFEWSGQTLKEFIENDNGYSKEEIVEALKDEKFAKEVIEANSSNIYQIPKEVFSQNPNLYEVCMRADNKYMHYVPRQYLQEKPELCMEIFEKDPWSLQDMPNSVQEQYGEKILKTIAERYPLAIRFATNQIKLENPETCLNIMKENSELLCYLPDKIQEENVSIVKEIVEQNPMVYEYLSEKIKTQDPNFDLEILEKNPFIINEIPAEILNQEYKNGEQIISAIEKVPSKFFSMPEEIQNKMIDDDFGKLSGELQEFLIKNLPKDKAEPLRNSFARKEYRKELEDLTMEFLNMKTLGEVTKEKFEEIYNKAKDKVQGAFSRIQSIVKQQGKEQRDDDERNN